MKRDPALIPFSHDHQNTLARALRLRRVADGDDSQRSRETTEFVAFANARIRPHFIQEEELLDRAVAASTSPEIQAGSSRMRDEHDWLRTRFDEIQSLQRRDETPSGTLLGETGTRLTEHVRFEERELFELLQRELGDQLAQLAAELRPQA